MKLYNYECLNKDQQIVKGQIKADNLDQALDMLRKNDLAVLDINEFNDVPKNSVMSRGKKVSVSELTIFTRQFATMIGAGIHITRAIVTMSQQSSNPTLRSALENIASNVEGGMSLSDAFSAYPSIFSNLYISMIHAGEVGGILEHSLLRLSEQLQKEKFLKDEIKSATTYPKIIGVFAVLIFIAMIVFLVPVFEGFIPSNIEMPGITKFIFRMSHSIKEKWYIWIAVITAIISGVYAFFKGKMGHDLWERYKTNMPVFGSIILKTVIARFTSTLSTLLEGGIPIVQALKSAGPTAGSDVLARTIDNTIEEIEKGRSIASTLQKSEFFPPMVTHMIAVGEEAGSLPTLLDKIAEFYEQEVATETRGLQALIQPVLLVLIGLLIGGMLIALYLPIFSAATSITT